MTQLETERIVRKITDLLQQAGNPEIAPKLAADYAAACQAANLRLQQCEAMIKAGDRPQAIQLAETAPNLLDLVTVLEFQGSGDWRTHCQQHSLPVGDRIDARSVQVLNECYGLGITTDDPLYTAYRRLILNRNDEEALKVLQSIVRLNPADTNAAAELMRLDAKVLAARLQHLEGSLQSAEPALVVAEIETIEAVGFKNKPEGEIWRQAQTVRCEHILAGTAGLKNAGQWLEVLAKLDFLHGLMDEFELQLPAASLRQLATVQPWAQGEQVKDKKNREFQSLISQLQQQIQESEEKDTSARYVKLPELKADFEGLHKTWRALADFTRPIAEDLTASFHKRTALLEAEIARRTAVRFRIILGCGATALVIIAGIAWLVAARTRSRDFDRQLQAAVEQRQVHAADKLLERAHSKKTGSAAGVAAAETFSAREHGLLVNFETAYNQLPRQLDQPPEAPRVAGTASQLGATRAALAALAPDLKAENEPRLEAFEKKWQDYLADSSATMNNQLAQWASAAGQLSDGLDYRTPLEKMAVDLATLAKLVQAMQDCETGFGKYLSLRSDLLERSAAVSAKFAKYNAEYNKVAGGMNAIHQARTDEEYAEGITMITSSEFTSAPASVAASAAQAADTSEENTLRILLQAGNDNAWACIKKGGPVSFVPEMAMPAERQILKSLGEDPAINTTHYHYRFDAGTEAAVDWVTVEPVASTSGILMSNSITGKLTERSSQNTIKAWIISDSGSKISVQDEVKYSYFNNHFIGEDGTPHSIVPLEVPDETSAFHSVGLDPFLITDPYPRPLLEVLDAVKDSRDGSPLFRAWLFMRLVELMNLQPDAWGLTFCPAATAHYAQIKRMVGDDLNSGDWFVPAKAAVLGGRLERFFNSVRPVSYARQATGLLTLDRQVVKDGLRYAGFVDLDGKPNLVDRLAPGKIWFYGKKQGQVGLSETATADKFPREQALPLSPIFRSAIPADDYLSAAAADRGDPSFQGVLPPLFQNPEN